MKWNYGNADRGMHDPERTLRAQELKELPWELQRYPKILTELLEEINLNRQNLDADDLPPRERTQEVMSNTQLIKNGLYYLKALFDNIAECTITARTDGSLRYLRHIHLDLMEVHKHLHQFKDYIDSRENLHVIEPELLNPFKRAKLITDGWISLKDGKYVWNETRSKEHVERQEQALFHRDSREDSGS